MSVAQLMRQGFTLRPGNILADAKKRSRQIVDPPQQQADTDPGAALTQRGVALITGAGQQNPADLAIAAQQRMLEEEAAKGPGKEDYQAAADQAMSEGLRRADAEFPSGPVPQQEPDSPIDLPRLSLPQAPHYQQASIGDVNPMASVGAAIAGLIAPAYAGELTAAALHGAIQKVDRKNALVDREYDQAFQRQVALNREQIRRAEDQARIDHENKQVKYENAREVFADTMRRAKDAGNRYTVEGEGKAFTELNKRSATARASEAGAMALKNILDQRFKDKEALQKEAVSLLETGGRVSELHEATRERIQAQAQVHADTLAKQLATRRDRKQFHADSMANSRAARAQSLAIHQDSEANANRRHADTEAHADKRAAMSRTAKGSLVTRNPRYAQLVKDSKAKQDAVHQDTAIMNSAHATDEDKAAAQARIYQNLAEDRQIRDEMARIIAADTTASSPASTAAPASHTTTSGNVFNRVP
jgi:hypothetical protein